MNYILYFKRILFAPIRKIKIYFYNNKYKKEIAKIYKENFIWSAQIGIADDISVKIGVSMAKTIVNSINNAFKINLKFNKNKSYSKYFNIFPGEHYKLLAGLIE